jgi:hypothetical protein
MAEKAMVRTISAIYVASRTPAVAALSHENSTSIVPSSTLASNLGSCKGYLSGCCTNKDRSRLEAMVSVVGKESTCPRELPFQHISH